jgi:hypothetical protein
MERLANADIDDDIGFECLDLKQPRQQVGRGSVEHNGLDLKATVVGLVLRLSLLGKTDAVIGGFGDDGDALEARLFDPAKPGRGTRRVDGVRKAMS